MYLTTIPLMVRMRLPERQGAVVKYEYQQGKGNVIRRMFREIDAECYVMTDGDDTYPAESAREMVDCVLNHHADMVVGDRLSSTYFEENKRPFHNFGNSLSDLPSIAFSTPISRIFMTRLSGIQLSICKDLSGSLPGL